MSVVQSSARGVFLLCVFFVNCSEIVKLIIRTLTASQKTLLYVTWQAGPYNSFETGASSSSRFFSFVIF
jgi:hypothetical protein